MRFIIGLVIFLIPFCSFCQQEIASSATWKVSYDSAQYYWVGNIQKSVRFLQTAELVAFQDLGIYDENYLIILNDLGLAYGEIKDFKRAEKYLTRNLTIQHELHADENLQSLRVSCNLAAIVLKSGDDIRARQLYKKILEMSTFVEAGEIYMTASENLARLYEVQEQYDSALSTINHALIASTADPLLETQHKFHLAQARLLRKMKHYGESEKKLAILNRSIHSTALKLPWLMYAVQLEQSLIKLEVGLYMQAEKDLLELYRTLKNQPSSDEMLLTEVTNAVAYAYEKLGIYDKAMLYYQESFGRCLKSYGYNSLSCAVMQNNMAGIMLKQGHASQAIAQYEEFIEMYKNLSRQNSSLYYAAVNNLATAYRQTGEYKKALAHYHSIYESLQRTQQQETDLAATVKNNLGVTQMLLGNYTEAEAYLTDVLRMKEQLFGKDSPVLLDVIENLAVTGWAAGKYEAALPLFNRSLVITERQIRYVFPNLTDQEQVQFYNRQKQNFERFNTLVLQQAGKMPQLKTQMFNNQLLLKSIVFFTSKKRNEQLRGNAPLTALVVQSEERRVRLGHCYQLTAEELQTLNISIPALEHQVDSLEKIIRHGLADESFNERHITWKDVQHSLQADEALVDIIRFRKYDVFKTASESLAQQVNTGFTDSVMYAALITTTETMEGPELVFLKNGRLLESRNHKFYINTLRFDMEDTISYAAYWLPIERKLPGKKKIFLTPDGVFHQVNLNVIRDRQSHFVIEKFDLHLLMNPAQLLKRHQTPKIDFTKAVLIGDPVFNQVNSTSIAYEYESLPGSNEEIKGILHALKLTPSQVTVHMRHAASEGNLKKVRGPSILHIATHGFFSTDLIRLNDQVKNDFMFHSGLILSSSGLANKNFDNDGIVSAYEVMDLDLTGTELVVLSACETGLGKVEYSEGVYGLQRSFLQAGANNIMISLWKVEDIMTKDLMIKFYTYLGRNHSAHEAFKLAQLDMMKTVGSPRVWGGFVMVTGN